MLEEFKKAKPLTFNGEVKKSEDEKAWLLGMKKFFKIHDYFENMKEKIVAYSLKGREDIWWEDLKNVKGIREERLNWNEFEKLFKEKYLSDKYYDSKAKDFYELKLVQLLDEEYITILLKPLRYVPYIEDDKAKLQLFIDEFPMSFSDCIEFYEPQSLDYAMKKFKKCYEQAKWRPNFKSDQKLKEVGKTSINGPKKIINKKESASLASEGHGNGTTPIHLIAHTKDRRKYQ